MKLFIRNLTALILLCGFVVSCIKDTLVLPSVEQGEAIVTKDRPTAKPSNLNVVTLNNHITEIYWPELSDRVVKATISYTENGENKVLEIIDFNQPVVIKHLETRDYILNFTYFTNTGLASKVTEVELTPGKYETQLKLDNLDYEAVPGGVKFYFDKTSDKIFKYTVTYAVNDIVKQVVAEGNDISEIVATGIIDSENPTEFKIEVEDLELENVATINISRVAGRLQINEIIPSVFYKVTGNDVLVGWKNTNSADINVEIHYDGSKVATYSGADVNGSLNFTTSILPQTITFILKDVTGTELTGTFSINSLSFVSTQGSTITASSTASGTASNIVDGDINTYWVSEAAAANDPSTPGYDASAPYKSFNHFFTIDYKNDIMLGKVSLHKRAGFTNGFDLYKIEISNDGVSFTTVANNIVFDATLEQWQDYNLSQPIKCRYVRITMTSPRWECCDGFSQIGEFRAYSY